MGPRTGYMNAEMWPPSSWTSAIVSAIKAVDGNHLIIDGAFDCSPRLFGFARPLS